MVPDEKQTPDREAIKRDLAYMMRRWDEIEQPVMFELRAFGEGKQPHHARFAPDWIDEGVDWAADMNALGLNVYAVRNPVRDTGSKAATDADVVAAFFLWADCDDPASAGNVHRFDGPKWSAAVTTGRTPSTRVHVYWELEEPCLNLDAWRQMQTDIAAHFKSDPAVINPSRVMRVGGTVAYPDSKKKAKGYISEIATIRTEYPDDREPVSFDQMRRVFPISSGRTAQAGPEGAFQIDTGPQPLDRAMAAANILAGTDWRENVKKLVASYVARGWSDDEILTRCRAFTLDGWTVEDTDRDVIAFIKWTREQEAKHGGQYATSPTQFDAPPVQPTPETIQDFPILGSADFLSDLRPLEYLIDGLLPVGVAYSLTGYPGHGKTTLALQFALSVARGEMFSNRETSKGSVLILAGENPYNVKWQYAAALAARGLSPADADIHFVQGRFSIKQWAEVLRAKLEAMPDLKLIVVDSLQAFFEGDNDNDNTQMVEMAHRLRALANTSQRPAILIIAHPAGKTPSKENLVPRGGGAFLAEIDGNLTVWSQDASQQTLHHSQKFRGASFDPMEWVMQVHEFSHLTDIHGTPLKLPVSRPETVIEQSCREEQSDTILRRYLLTVEAEAPLSVREAASQFHVSRYRMEQVIKTAKEEKLIRRYAKTYVLTDGGKDFLEAQNAGL